VRARRPTPTYALVLKKEGFEFLIDPRDLWKPPRVVVRSGYSRCEVRLDEENVSFMKPSTFHPHEEKRVLALVRDNFDDLQMWWCTLKDDVRRGRLERNVLVD
jgi:hypothetical protein